MGVVAFISFKNNKKSLLKNIFIQKDVHLNLKSNVESFFPFEFRAIEFPVYLAPFVTSIPSSQVSQGHTVGLSGPLCMEILH